jgi:hypothetical protein
LIKFVLVYVTAYMMQGGLHVPAGALNAAPRFDTLAQCQTEQVKLFLPAGQPEDPGWQCIQRAE